jgi:hypothetical protein
VRGKRGANPDAKGMRGPESQGALLMGNTKESATTGGREIITNGEATEDLEVAWMTPKDRSNFGQSNTKMKNMQKHGKKKRKCCWIS